MTSKLFWLVHVSEHTQIDVSLNLSLLCLQVTACREICVFHTEKFPGGGGIAIIESAPGPDFEILDGVDL